MKTILFLAAIPLMAFAALESASVGGGYTPKAAARVESAEVVSTVADASATISAVTELHAVSNAVQTFAATNVSYVLVYSNGLHQVHTNVSDRPIAIPSTVAVLFYATNVAVRAWSVTNAVDYVALVHTNALGTVTCTGAYGSASIGAYVAPGARIISSGTAKGRVLIFLSR